MNRVLLHILLVVSGILLFGAVLLFEIDGGIGFLMATIGIFLIGIGLSLRYIIRMFIDFF